MSTAAKASKGFTRDSVLPKDKTASTARSGQIVSFRLGKEEYGLDIMRIQEIILVGEVTEIPQVPEFVRGIINLRGHVIPVIDLRTHFGLPICEKTEEQRIIVVNVGSKTIGIVVDAVSQVLRVTDEQVEPAPTGIRGVHQSFIRGLAKVGEKLIILLEIDGLLSNENQQEIEQTTAV